MKRSTIHKLLVEEKERWEKLPFGLLSDIPSHATEPLQYWRTAGIRHYHYWVRVIDRREDSISVEIAIGWEPGCLASLFVRPHGEGSIRFDARLGAHK